MNGCREAGDFRTLPNGACRRILHAIALTSNAVDRPFDTSIHLERARTILSYDPDLEDDPSKAVLTVLHEGGTPLHQVFPHRIAIAVGEAEHGLHESQSGCGRTMWAEVLRSGYLHPVLRSLFPDEMRDWSRKLPSRRQCGSTRRYQATPMRCHIICISCFDMSWRLRSSLGPSDRDLRAAWNERSAH